MPPTSGMVMASTPPNIAWLFLLPFLLVVFIPSSNVEGAISSSYTLMKAWKVARLHVGWDKTASVSKYKVEFNFFSSTKEFDVDCSTTGVEGNDSSLAASRCTFMTPHLFPNPAEHEVEIVVKNNGVAKKDTVGKTFLVVKIPHNISSCDVEYKEYMEVGKASPISINVQPSIGVDPAQIIWSGIGFRPINTTERVMFPIYEEPDLHTVEAMAVNIYSECHSFAQFEVEYPNSKVPLITSVGGNASAISINQGDTVHFSCNSTGTSPKFFWQMGVLNSTSLTTSSCSLDYLFNETGIFDIYLTIRNEINEVVCDPITATVKKRPITPAKVATSVVPTIIIVCVVIVVAIGLQRYHAWYKRQGQVEHANLLINSSSERRQSRSMKRDYGSVELLEVH